MLELALRITESLGYFGIAFLTFLETIFPPLPSEVIMPFGGFAASQGRLELTGVIIAGTLGSLLGALLLYLLGKIFREDQIEDFLVRKSGVIRLTKEEVRKTQSWFDRHGYFAVLLCRFIPGVRSIISIPAGIRRLRVLPFLLYSAIGTGIWTAGLTIAGYFLGQEYQKIEEELQPYSLALVVIFAVLVIWLLWRRIKIGREHTAVTTEKATPTLPEKSRPNKE